MKRVDPSTINKVARLRKGSYSVVYLLESEDFGKVAGKYIDKFDSSFQERVTRVIEMIKHIRHPNIISLYGICETDEFFIVLMNYADNGDLFKYITGIREKKIEFVWPERYQMCIEICRGLKALHDSNIIHRDFKSNNILLDKENHPMITGFMVSKVIDEFPINSTLNGSICWSAPETKDGIYTKESDIYSLGVIFWEIGTGNIPFENIDYESIFNSKLEFPDGFPLVFKELIEECLDRNPAKRPNIQTILDKLKRIPSSTHLYVSQKQSSPQLYSSQKGDISLPMKKIDPSTIKKVGLLGKGSYASVYKIESKDDVVIAGKYFDRFDKNFENISSEIKIMNYLRHPNIISLYGICETDEFFIVLMNYADNGDLFKYITGIREKKIEFVWPERYQMCIEICRGLKALHDSNIIHRDFKSNNILLDKENHPMITDFGLSKVIDESPIKSTLNDIGNIRWRAPETKDGIYTKESDIYSLGVIFWEIGTCEAPPNDSKPECPDGFPLVFKELIEECLDQNPQHRPNISTILSKLESFI